MYVNLFSIENTDGSLNFEKKNINQKRQITIAERFLINTYKMNLDVEPLTFLTQITSQIIKCDCKFYMKKISKKRKTTTTN